MNYPDFSQLWLSAVNDGRGAFALDESQISDEIVKCDELEAANALGKSVSLGNFNGNELTWTIVSVCGNLALALCDAIVATKPAYDAEIDEHAPGWWCGTPSWLNNDVRSWLALEFAPKAFDAYERTFLESAFGDRSPNPCTLVVLSAEEVETYVPESLRACIDTSWWLRDPSSMGRDGQPTYVDEMGNVCAGGTAKVFRGVRPVATIRMWK